jgi:hypothetical protein
MEIFLLVGLGLVAVYFVARRFEGASGLRRHTPDQARTLLLAYHDRFRMAPPGPTVVPAFLDPDVLLDAVAEALRFGEPVTFPELRNLDSRVDAGTAEEIRGLLGRARELEQEATRLREQARHLMRTAIAR